ncbi:MAG: DUF4335 domain-containing protein [Elainellaceae cyanobacterium]
MSTSVLRRYTPPTCTLEIAATGSVLSRWTDRTVLKNLRFELSFDDPKLSSDQQISIRGNRIQLEALCEAVEGYVQALLNQPAQAIPLQTTATLPALRSPSNLETAETSNLTAARLVTDPTNLGIYLKPKGLLAHELHLGTLANEGHGTIVPLTALQLFDLTNALDEYRAEALTLPALNRPAWLKSPAGWAKIAAVLVLGLGATGAIAKFVIDVSSPVSQVASSSREVEISAAQQPESSEASPRLPVPTLSNSPGSTDLALEPFPPKPPAGAAQPSLIPPPNAGAPPAGVTVAPSTVPLEQMPTQALTAPSEQEATASNDVIIVPPEEAGGTAQVPLDPLADAPPTAYSSADVASAAGVAPPATSESRVAPLSPDSVSQARQSEAATSVATSRTAFDTYPQIAEVREYFQQNWQPPEELAQTLEYRLVLNNNGTIRQIIPLGEASGLFVDRTQMPLMGEPFVSPLENRNQLQVRLVLKPDGSVQTFPDGNP